MSKDNISLTDYILERAWGKSDSYNKQEITALLDIIRNNGVEIISIVNELPTENIKTNHLYLLYNTGDVQGNLFDVYVYVNGKWEQIDNWSSLDFDLSDYYTINELDNLLRSKATREDLINVRNSLQTTSGSLTALYDNLTNFNDVLITFDEDNTNLSSDLSKLKDNLLIFVNRVNGMIEDIDELGGDLTELNGGLETTNASLEDLSDSLTDLGDSVSTLGSDLTATRNELNTTKTTLNNTQTGLNNLSDELDDAKSSFEEAQESIVSLQADIIQFASDLTGLGTSLDTTNTSLNSAKSDLNTLKNTTIPTIREDITSIQGDISGLQDDFDDLEYNTTELSSQLGTLNSNLNGTNNNLSDLGTSLGNLTTRTTTLETGMRNLNSSTTTLNNDVSTLKSKATQFTDDITTLNGSLNALDGRLDGVDTSLSNLVTKDTELTQSLTGLTNNLNNIHNSNNTGLLDTTRDSLTNLASRTTTLEGSLSNLESKNERLDQTLNNLTEDIANADGHMLATANDMAELSNKLIYLVSDLNVLGDYLNTFEGDLNEFKEGLDEEDLEILTLDDDIIKLFGAIGSVKSTVTTLDGQMTTVQGDISDVQTDLYGDENDPSDNGLFGEMETAQTDIRNSQTAIQGVKTEIYGDPTTTDGGIIGALLGNYSPSSTAFYTYTSSENYNPNQALGTNYRVQLTNNGSNAYIRSSNDTKNLIRLAFNQNRLYLSIRVNNVYVVENFVVKNEYVDIVNGRVIYDNTNYYDLADTIVDTTNLYQMKGTVTFYRLTTVDGGLLSEIDSTNTAIDNTNTRIDGVQTDITGVNTAISTANGQITQVKSDITTAKSNISQVQVDMYGSNKDPNNPQDNSLVKTLSDVQDDITDVQTDVNDVQSGINSVNVELYGSGGTSSSPKTGSVVKNIQTAQTNINTATTNINTIKNTTIPNVQNSVNQVKVDLFGGTTSNPGTASNPSGGLAKDLIDFEGDLTDVNNTLDGITNDNNTGTLDKAVSNISTSQTKISTVETKIYGTGGTASNLKSDGLIKKLDTTNSNLDTANGKIDTLNNTTIPAVNQQISSTNTAINNATARIDTVTNTNGTGSLDVVQNKIYGSGGSATNLKSDGALKKIEVAQGNIQNLHNDSGTGLIDIAQDQIEVVQKDVYGDPNDVNDGGIIGSILGNYVVSSSTSYAYNSTTASTIKRDIGEDYRINLSTTAGSTVYIRGNSDGKNQIRLFLRTVNQLELSIMVDNTWVLNNVILKNNYIDVVGKKVIYDNAKYFDLKDTVIQYTNLYSVKGKVDVYPITLNDEGLITVINNTGDSIDVVQGDIGLVQEAMYGEDINNPSEGSVMSDIKVAQGDITKAQGTIDTVTNTSGTGSLDKLITQVGTDTSNTSSTSLWGKVRGVLSSVEDLEGVVGTTSQTTGNTIWAKVNSLLSGTDSALYKLFGKTDGSTTNYTSGSIWGKIKGIENGLQGQIDDIKENAPYIYQFELYKVTFSSQYSQYQSFMDNTTYYDKLTPDNVKWGDWVLVVLTVRQNNEIVSEQLDNIKVTVTPTTGEILDFESMSYITGMGSNGNGWELKNNANQIVGYVNNGYICAFKIEGTGLYKVSCKHTEVTFNIADWITRDIFYEKYYGDGQIYVSGSEPKGVCKLYINPSIRLCELYFEKTFSSGSADTTSNGSNGTSYTWFEAIVPSEYRTSYGVMGGLNYGGSCYVTAGGSVGGRLANAFSVSRTLKGTVVWHY